MAVRNRETAELIGKTARRIRRFFEAMSQGHDFGISPGPHDHPWTLEFQRDATPIYAETCPWEYLLGLCNAYEELADLMDTRPATDELKTEWTHMQEYLRSTGTAMRSRAPDEVGPLMLAHAEDIEPQAPPVVLFGRLATLVSIEGARNWAQEVGRIEAWCGQEASCPITEQERVWLRRISAGDRTLDIARDSGYSERSLYRALADLWCRLQVDNRVEAVAVATKNGWI